MKRRFDYEDFKTMENKQTKKNCVIIYVKEVFAYIVYNVYVCGL